MICKSPKTAFAWLSLLLLGSSLALTPAYAEEKANQPQKKEGQPAAKIDLISFVTRNLDAHQDELKRLTSRGNGSFCPLPNGQVSPVNGLPGGRNIMVRVDRGLPVFDPVQADGIGRLSVSVVRGSRLAVDDSTALLTGLPRRTPLNVIATPQEIFSSQCNVVCGKDKQGNPRLCKRNVQAVRRNQPFNNAHLRASGLINVTGALSVDGNALVAKSVGESKPLNLTYQRIGTGKPTACTDGRLQLQRENKTVDHGATVIGQQVIGIALSYRLPGIRETFELDGDVLKIPVLPDMESNFRLTPKAMLFDGTEEFQRRIDTNHLEVQTKGSSYVLIASGLGYGVQYVGGTEPTEVTLKPHFGVGSTARTITLQPVPMRMQISPIPSIDRSNRIMLHSGEQYKAALVTQATVQDGIGTDLSVEWAFLKRPIGTSIFAGGQEASTEFSPTKDDVIGNLQLMASIGQGIGERSIGFREDIVRSLVATVKYQGQEVGQFVEVVSIQPPALERFALTASINDGPAISAGGIANLFYPGGKGARLKANMGFADGSVLKDVPLHQDKDKQILTAFSRGLRQMNWVRVPQTSPRKLRTQGNVIVPAINQPAKAKIKAVIEPDLAFHLTNIRVRTSALEGKPINVTISELAAERLFFPDGSITRLRITGPANLEGYTVQWEDAAGPALSVQPFRQDAITWIADAGKSVPNPTKITVLDRSRVVVAEYDIRQHGILDAQVRLIAPIGLRQAEETKLFAAVRGVPVQNLDDYECRWSVEHDENFAKQFEKSPEKLAELPPPVLFALKTSPLEPVSGELLRCRNLGVATRVGAYVGLFPPLRVVVVPKLRLETEEGEQP